MLENRARVAEPEREFLTGRSARECSLGCASVRECRPSGLARSGSNSRCRQLESVRCQRKQLEFRVRKCARGNNDPCLGL
jgi:hypothetical protein